MTFNLYTYEGVAQIMRTEERNGRIKSCSYSATSGVWELSSRMKKTRAAIRRAKPDERGELRLELKRLQDQYKEQTRLEHERIAKEITNRSFIPELSRRYLDKDIYIADGTNTVVVSKIIARELQQEYALHPQNRDVIVEQLSGLLDGAMSKVVLRADVCDFYESISIEPLMHRIEADGKLSTYSLKYLRSFIYAYNELRPIDENHAIGIPRGLAFSAALSELYMEEIDERVRHIPGVYFYKRYVDDMVIVANPEMGMPEEYWERLKQCFADKQLTIHEEGKKKYTSIWRSDTEVEKFTYLGYTFLYNKGVLDVLLSDARFDKYRILIDAIFEIYAKCAKGRRRTKTEDGEVKPPTALHQLKTRLRVLTGNGLLRGNKCFVANGVYYTNRYLTNLCQLEELDRYLYEVIDTRFNPPAELYKNDFDSDNLNNVAGIRKQLKRCSFIKSFQLPQIMTDSSYEWELTQLKHIYLSRTRWGI